MSHPEFLILPTSIHRQVFQALPPKLTQNLPSKPSVTAVVDNNPFHIANRVIIS